MRRSLSGVERLWLAADRIAPPFLNQLVIEGEGDEAAEEERSRWEAAIRAVSDAQRGSRAVLCGRLRSACWEFDGPVPAFRVVEGGDWDGMGPENAPFLRQRLDPVFGPSAEVLQVRGRVPRVIVRTHHAACDGQATLLFAQGLFAALRGETPGPARSGSPVDLDLLGGLDRCAETPPAADCAAPVSGAAEPVQGVTWARHRFEGRPSKLLPRIARGVARQVGGACRVDVPVDLRRRRPLLRSSANLTGLLRLTVRPDADVEEVEAALRAGIEAGAHADFVLAADRFRGLPLGLLAAVGASASRRRLSGGLFETSATLSNLGLHDLASLSAPGFEARRCFWIPPGSPGLPLFLTLSGDPGGVEMCGSMPAGLASRGRLRSLLAALAAELASPS